MPSLACSSASRLCSRLVIDGALFFVINKFCIGGILLGLPDCIMGGFAIRYGLDIFMQPQIDYVLATTVFTHSKYCVVAFASCGECVWMLQFTCGRCGFSSNLYDKCICRHECFDPVMIHAINWVQLQSQGSWAIQLGRSTAGKK